MAGTSTSLMGLLVPSNPSLRGNPNAGFDCKDVVVEDPPGDVVVGGGDKILFYLGKLPAGFCAFPAI